jgi:hypothetical protein
MLSILSMFGNLNMRKRAMCWRCELARKIEEEAMPVYHSPVDGSLKLGTKAEAEAAKQEKQRQQEQAAERIAKGLGSKQQGGTVSTDGTSKGSQQWS